MYTLHAVAPSRLSKAPGFNPCNWSSIEAISWFPKFCGQIQLVPLQFGTPITVWDATKYAVKGSISYQSAIDVSLAHACPSLPEYTPTGDTGAGVLRVPSGDAAYCAERGGDTVGGCTKAVNSV